MSCEDVCKCYYVKQNNTLIEYKKIYYRHDDNKIYSVVRIIIYNPQNKTKTIFEDKEQIHNRKIKNLKKVLNFLHKHGYKIYPTISRETGLSELTISRLIKEIKENNLFPIPPRSEIYRNKHCYV